MALKDIFLQAGFNDVRAGASFDFFATKEDVQFKHGFISDWFYTPGVIAAAIKLGLATQEKFDRWRKELDLWRDYPGACGGFAFGHAIASKPG